MGTFPSKSIGRFKNDYELVVRAAKECVGQVIGSLAPSLRPRRLELVLEADFGAGSGRNHFLHDKIGEATIHLKSLERPPPLTSGSLTVDLYMKTKGVTGQLQVARSLSRTKRVILCTCRTTGRRHAHTTLSLSLSHTHTGTHARSRMPPPPPAHHPSTH